MLMRLEHNDIRITSNKLDKNSGYGNMFKNPTIARKVYVVDLSDVSWLTYDDFLRWLEDSFGHGKLPDATYCLWGWNRVGFFWKKIHKFCKRFVSFAKFEVDGGSIRVYRKNSRGRTYKSILMFEKNKEINILQKRPKMLRIE